MILAHGRRLFTVRALSFVDTLILDREVLFKLLKTNKFNLINKKIRIATLRLALQRWFRRVGSSLVKVKLGFRKPLTKDEIEAVKKKWDLKAKQTKTIGAPSGHKLDAPILSSKLDILRLVCPGGCSLFPTPPKLTTEEIILKDIYELKDQFSHLTSCLAAISSQLEMQLPKPPKVVPATVDFISNIEVPSPQSIPLYPCKDTK